MSVYHHDIVMMLSTIYFILIMIGLFESISRIQEQLIKDNDIYKKTIQYDAVSNYTRSKLKL